MAARRYRPARRGAAGALAALAAFAGVAAAVVGAGAHAFGRLLFPVDVVVPILVGGALGALLGGAVIRLRTARPAVVAAIAGLAAAGALAIQLGLDFVVARSAHADRLDQRARIRERIGMATRDELDMERADELAGWTLRRYVAARIGLDDSGAFTGAPPVLGRTGAVSLSVLELMLALGIAAAWAAREAAQPICERCGAWRVEQPLGAARLGVTAAVVERLEAGDAAAAATLLDPPDTRERVLVSALPCPVGHDAAPVIRFAEVRWTRRRRLALRRVVDLELTCAELEILAARLAGGGPG